ncbi:MAG TPA: protoporphyrinogen oxidase [Thermomicrobiales bacterium]|nr:protoporphyrinogen oxidase [Thermomicrobiales bacterium]
MQTVAVVGGGISGLAAAYRLVTSGQDVRVLVLEASDHLGGIVRTEHVDGFTIDGGPDSFLLMKPRGIGLARELGLEDRLQWTNEANRGSFLYRKGALHPLPEGLTGLIPTKLAPMVKTPLVSPRGKARMALDFVLPSRKGDGDESLRAFISRRLGPEVFDNLIEPLMAGIYSGDGSQLSLAATFPQLRAAEKEHGGLIKGVLAGRKQQTMRAVGHQTRQGFVSFRTGMHELPDALKTAIETHGGVIKTRRRVTRIDQMDDGRFVVAQDGENRAWSDLFDKVILAAPVCVQAGLLQYLDAEAAHAMAEIPVASSAAVLLGYRETGEVIAPRDYGYLVPRVEQRPIKAITWLSSKWEDRAPEGHFLVRAFIGRVGQQEVLQHSDDELVGLVRQELREVSAISGDPVVQRVYRLNEAMPQYTVGHLERVARLEAALERVPGLEIAGNMLRGVGIPDIIAAGESAADRLLGRQDPVSS